MLAQVPENRSKAIRVDWLPKERLVYKNNTNLKLRFTKFQMYTPTGLRNEINVWRKNAGVLVLSDTVAQWKQTSTVRKQLLPAAEPQMQNMQ